MVIDFRVICFCWFTLSLFWIQYYLRKCPCLHNNLKIMTSYLLKIFQKQILMNFILKAKFQTSSNYFYLFLLLFLLSSIFFFYFWVLEFRVLGFQSWGPDSGVLGPDVLGRFRLCQSHVFETRYN